MCPLQRTPPIKVLMCCLQHWSYRCFSSSSFCWPSTAWGENTDTRTQETQPFSSCMNSHESERVRPEHPDGGSLGAYGERWLMGKQLRVQQGSRSTAQSGLKVLLQHAADTRRSGCASLRIPALVFLSYLMWSPSNICNISAFYTDSKATEKL